MQTDTIQTSNPFISDIKKNYLGFEFKNTISSIKQKVVFLTDEESAINSQKMVEEFIKCKKSLPSDSIDDISEAKKFLNIWKSNVKILDEFLNSLSGITIDDKHAKELYKNIKHAKAISEFIVDYIELVIKTYEADKSLEKLTKSYSAKELDNLLQ